MMDALGAIDAWVVSGQAPERIVASRPLDGGARRTRPPVPGRRSHGIAGRAARTTSATSSAGRRRADGGTRYRRIDLIPTLPCWRRCRWTRLSRLGLAATT